MTAQKAPKLPYWFWQVIITILTAAAILMVGALALEKVAAQYSAVNTTVSYAWLQDAGYPVIAPIAILVLLLVALIFIILERYVRERA